MGVEKLRPLVLLSGPTCVWEEHAFVCGKWLGGEGGVPQGCARLPWGKRRDVRVSRPGAAVKQGRVIMRSGGSD